MSALSPVSKFAAPTRRAAPEQAVAEAGVWPRMKLSRLLTGAAPFVLVVLIHYVRFATVSLHGTQPAHPARRLRLHHSGPVAAAAQEPGEAPATRLARLEAAAAAGKAAAARLEAKTTAAAQAAAVRLEAKTEAEKRRAKCQSYSSHAHALSSSDATAKMLACAGLLPEPGVGLSEVLTAERIDALLPRDAVVYLTFCNYAYLHFAQNWWSQVHRHTARTCALRTCMHTTTLRMCIRTATTDAPHASQVRSIGRHGQVVVAALDAATLQAWRELRVHVLDFTEFGDASDFRGIGADQAR